MYSLKTIQCYSLKNYAFLFYVHVCGPKYMSRYHVFGEARGGQKRVSDPDLEAVVGYHIGARNQT